MKKYILSFLAAFAALHVSAQIMPQNPVIERFPDHVTFYLNFDNGDTTPAIGIGKNSNRQGHTFGKGIFGKALRAGVLHYSPKGLIDTSAPGSLIFWFSVVQPVPKAKKEPGASFFILNLPGRKRLLVYKQGLMSWGYGNIQFRVELGKAYSASLRHTVSELKTGQWNMVAINWNPDRIGISLNGTPMKYAGIQSPPGHSDRGALMFHCTKPKDANNPRFLQYLLDEITILDRNLTDREVRSIYQTMLQRAK